MGGGLVLFKRFAPTMLCSHLLIRVFAQSRTLPCAEVHFFSVTVSLYCDGVCKIELLADKPAKRKDQGRHGGPFSRRGAAD